MEAKKIIMTVTNNLETDQRVHKVATTFHENGWNVLVVGTDSRPCNKAYSQAYSTHRLHVHFKKGPLFYIECNLRLFFYLLSKKCDRIWGNDTDTALAAFFASKIKNVDLTMDFHELFPEVPEVTDRKFVKMFWTKIEDFIIPRLNDGYTVCQSIADYYKKKYGTTLKVLRNVPLSKPYKKENIFNNSEKKIILYQGAVNEGRGVDWVIKAMPYIENALFIVIGNGDKKEEMIQLCKELKVEDKVIFKGFIPFNELPSYTNSADLGVCLLEAKGLSYYYSLPNRIFDFMQAHVPILATNFPEIRNIIEKEKTGMVIDHYEPQYLAEKIKQLLEAPIDHERFSTAAAQHNWEKEKKQIQ